MSKDELLMKTFDEKHIRETIMRSLHLPETKTDVKR